MSTTTKTSAGKSEKKGLGLTTWILLSLIAGIVVGIMLVLFIGSDEEIKKAERYILESNEEYKEVVLP